MYSIPLLEIRYLFKCKLCKESVLTLNTLWKNCIQYIFTDDLVSTLLLVTISTFVKERKIGNETRHS